MQIENLLAYVIIVITVIISIFYFVKSIIGIFNKKSECSSCSSEKVCKKEIKKP
ncbi:MAG: hypothetical protein N2258_02700 [Brevinematales bacterium]|nr:hypothetical protein [Brevinematales bacterium]